MSKHVITPKSAKSNVNKAEEPVKRGPGRPPKAPAEKRAPALTVGERCTMLLTTMVGLGAPFKVVKKGRGRPEITAKDGSRVPSEKGVWTRDFLRIVRRAPDKFGVEPNAGNQEVYAWLKERIDEGALEAAVRQYTDKATGEDRTYISGAIYLPGFGPQTSGAGQDARADEVLEALNF